MNDKRATWPAHLQTTGVNRARDEFIIYAKLERNGRTVPIHLARAEAVRLHLAIGRYLANKESDT